MVHRTRKIQSNFVNAQVHSNHNNLKALNVDLEQLSQDSNALEKSISYAKVSMAKSGDHELSKYFSSAVIDSIELQQCIIDFQINEHPDLPPAKKQSYNFDDVSIKIILLKSLLEDINARSEQLLVGEDMKI